MKPSRAALMITTAGDGEKSRRMKTARQKSRKQGAVFMQPFPILMTAERISTQTAIRIPEKASCTMGISAKFWIEAAIMEMMI